MTVNVGHSILRCVICHAPMAPGEAIEIERKGVVVLAHRPGIAVPDRAIGQCFYRATSVAGVTIRLHDPAAADEYDAANGA